MSQRRIMILDDDPELRDFVSMIAEAEGFNAQSVATFAEFKNLIFDYHPDLLILDLSLEDTDGVEVLRFISGGELNASVLLVSSFDERLLRSALNLGASYGLNMLGNLQKPLRPADLKNMFAQLPEISSNVREGDLSSALESDQLFLTYQPKVDIKTKRVQSAEALVRWNDPKRGMIYPDEFISLAEKSGLIEPMTDRVLKLAIHEAKKWQDRGWDIAVAVNLSAGSLVDLEFPNKVEGILKQEGLSASRLILEVTESTAMTDAKATMDILTRLRIKGINVSLDDFGTGYSSLVELHRMPFSELKIDRSFVMGSDKDKDARVIVEAIMGLAHALDLKVVAEGVETQAHWDMLEEMGCDVAQGYYLSKPIPPEEFRAWVEKWNDQVFVN